MATLITGAGGFVGTALARRLLGQGEAVVGLLRDYHDEWTRRHLFSDNQSEYNLSFGSVEDTDAVYRLLVDYGVTRVFHLAAQSTVAACQENPIGAWRSNVLGTVSVLEAVRQRTREGIGIRMVCATTDKVYGAGPTPYREDQPLLGIETYPATKVAADVAARSYAHTYGLNVSVVRSCNVYGPGDVEFSRLIPGSIKRMLSGELAILYEDAARMVREFVYIDDEVDAYLTVAREGQAGEAYNVHGSGPVRVGDLIGLLAEICGGAVQTLHRDVKEIQVQYMDGAKIESIGWNPTVGLEDGLRRTVQWYKSYLGRAA